MKPKGKFNWRGSLNSYVFKFSVTIKATLSAVYLFYSYSFFSYLLNCRLCMCFPLHPPGMVLIHSCFSFFPPLILFVLLCSRRFVFPWLLLSLVSTPVSSQSSPLAQVFFLFWVLLALYTMVLIFVVDLICGNFIV